MLSVKEDLTHWVWVAGVDTEYSTVDDKVSYTWSGTDLHNIQGTDDKGTPLRNLWPKTNTHLPWSGGYDTVDSGAYAGRTISTTQLIWNWYANDYTPQAGHENPSATTRYYDGSP